MMRVDVAGGRELVQLSRLGLERRGGGGEAGRVGQISALASLIGSASTPLPRGNQVGSWPARV
ncbi:MAG: hypothetical protein QM775_32645 [Pirellulales bacterium]